MIRYDYGDYSRNLKPAHSFFVERRSDRRFHYNQKQPKRVNQSLISLNSLRSYFFPIFKQRLIQQTVTVRNIKHTTVTIFLKLHYAYKSSQLFTE